MKIWKRWIFIVIKCSNSNNIWWWIYNYRFQNLRGEIEKIAKFLNKPLKKEQLDTLAEHLKFENFQKNESVNFEAGKKMVGFMNQDLNFMRKGTNKNCNLILYLIKL